MVLTTVRVLIPPEKRHEAFGILRMMAEWTRYQPAASARINHDEQVEAVSMDVNNQRCCFTILEKFN